jgi:hypothetical protein
MAFLINFLSIPHQDNRITNQQDKIAADMLDLAINCKLFLYFFRLVANQLGNRSCGAGRSRFDFVLEASGVKIKVKGPFDEGASARLSNMAKCAQVLQQAPTAERVERVAQTLIGAGVLGGVACIAI